MKLTEDMREAMRKWLYDNRLTMQRAGKIIGVDQSTVCRWLKGEHEQRLSAGHYQSLIVHLRPYMEPSKLPGLPVPVVGVPGEVMQDTHAPYGTVGRSMRITPTALRVARLFDAMPVQQQMAILNWFEQQTGETANADAMVFADGHKTGHK